MTMMTDLFNCDNMSLKDARDIYMHIEKNQILKNYSFPQKPGKDGYYRIYVSDITKSSGRRQLFAKSIEELRDKVYEYEKREAGSTSKSFADVFEIVVSQKLKYVKDPEKKLSRQNTISISRSNYNRYFDGTDFANMFIESITKKDIDKIILHNLNRYSMRDRAFNNMVGILRMVFSFAYEEYLITDNTFSRVNLKKYRDLLTPNVDIEKRVHSQDELSMILDALHEYQTTKPEYTPAWALEFQIIIGARRGEIAPLRRCDITDRYISISREQLTVKKFGDVPEHFKIVEHTKTYKNRVYPKTVLVNEYLDRLLAMLDKYYPGSEYLFPDKNTDLGVINNNTVYRLYSRICKKLGIKISRAEIKGTHSFRRNAITDVVNSTGGNVVLASKLFGNSPEVACKNYYTGIDLNEALEALNNRKLS